MLLCSVPHRPVTRTSIHNILKYDYKLGDGKTMSLYNLYEDDKLCCYSETYHFGMLGHELYNHYPSTRLFKQTSA